jgi:hypothetical protein
MNLLLDAALGYAAWSIRVYPVHWHHPRRAGPRLAALRQLSGSAGLRLPGPWHTRGAVAGTTGSARPGLGNRPPRGLAHVDWTGAAAAAACSRHPAATSPAAPTAGCAASIRRRCPRSPPPSAPCWTPTRRPRPGHPARPARPRPATPTAAPSAWPTPAPSRPHPAHQPGGRVLTGRWTYRISAAGVLVLAAAAFTLSYDALLQLALDSRVRPGLAWLWLVVIDGTIVVALLTVLAAKPVAARAGYPWALAGCSRPPR